MEEKELIISDLVPEYEHIRIKIGRTWYWIHPCVLSKKLKGTIIKGTIVKKRTRTWIE